MRTIARLVVVLVMLAAFALADTAQDEKPKLDLDTYLKQELKLLQGADPDKLSDSMLRIREALREDADTNDLLVAWFAEYHRRVAESDEVKKLEFPPLHPLKMPEGTNGWDDLVKAAKAAAEYEDKHGSKAHREVVDGTPLSKEAASLYLKDTADSRKPLSDVLSAKHITAPRYGLGDSIADIPSVPFAFWRVSTVRVHAHLTLDNRADAFAEAVETLKITGKTEFGRSALCELYAMVSHLMTLKEILLAPDWTSDEFDSLLASTNARLPSADWMLISEALYIVSAVRLYADAKRDDAAGLFMWVRDGDKGLETLLDEQVDSQLDCIGVRVTAGLWAHGQAGDIRDPEYSKELLEKLADDGPRAWCSRFADGLEGQATLLAANVKGAWLKGKRGDELNAYATGLATESKVFHAAVENGAVLVGIKDGHPLAPKPLSKPMCKVPLPKE